MSHTIDQDATRSRVRRVIAERAAGKQHTLATMADIQASMLSKILKGAEPITTKLLIKIEKGTGARLQWLESGVEPAYYEGDSIPDRDEAMYHQGAMLRAYLDAHNIEYSELGRRMSRAENTVSGYFKSEKFSKAIAKALCDALEVTPDILFNKNSGKPSDQKTLPVGFYHPQIAKDTVHVPYIDAASQINFNYENFFSVNNNNITNEPIPTYEVPASWMTKKNVQYAIVDVVGDAMQKTLLNGHQVLAYEVSSSDWPDIEGIVVVNYRGKIAIKRVADNSLLLTDGVVTLSSDNDNYATVRIPKSEILYMWSVIRNMGGPV